MGKTRILWAIAILVTMMSAVYQRMTGPTYPVKGHVILGGRQIDYRLERSHETTADQVVEIAAPDAAVAGETVPLDRQGDTLSATLPRQPAGGKLEYQIRLMRSPETVVIPAQPAVTRFKDPVALYVLIPHILAMFLGMLWSTRAGLAAVTGGPTRALAMTAVALIGVGGFVLGPWMQHQAFGEWWTGVPFGFDLTDNKTLIAMAFWVLAAFRLRPNRAARLEVTLAAIVTLGVFAIPHSVWGTEINWDALPK
jgi:hypothetical protein